MRRFLHIFLAVAALFLLTWVATIYWEFHSLHNLDFTISRLMNRLLNASETLDLTLLFFSQEAGSIVVSLFMAVVVVMLAGRNKKSSPLSVPLYCLFLGLLVCATLLAVELVDHYVRRPAPAVELAAFKNPGTLLEIRYDQPGRTVFPSVEIAVFSMILFVCTFRFGWRAMLLLPPMVLQAAAMIACGQAWPSDVAAGLFLGWTFASGTYVMRINEVYNNLESRCHEVWNQRLTSATRRMGSRLRHLTSRRRRSAVWMAPEVMESPTAADESHTVLPPELGALLKEQWGLSDPRALMTPHKGKLFAVADGGHLYAFKLTRRRGMGLAETTERLELAHSLREVHGLKVCAVIPTLSGDLAFPFDGRICYLMEWIPGKPLDTADDAQMCLLMGLLASLHRATLRSAEGEGAWDSLRRQVHAIASLSSVPGIDSSLMDLVAPSNREADKGGTLLKAQTKAALLARISMLLAIEENSLPHEALRHNDTHPMNYMLRPDGEMFILDFDRMGYGIPVMDIVKHLHRHARNTGWDAARCGRLVAAYEDVRRLPRWEKSLLLAHLMLPRPLLDIVSHTNQRDSMEETSLHGETPSLSWGIRQQSEAALQEAMVVELCRAGGFELMLGILNSRPASDTAGR